LRGRRQRAVVRQRCGLRQRLSVGRVVPRHLRHDRLLRLRWIPLFDWLSRRLGRRTICDRRAAQTPWPLHFRRRTGPQVQSARQTVTITADGHKLVNGKPQGHGDGQGDLRPVGHVSKLPGGLSETGPLGPIEFLSTIRDSEIVLWTSKTDEVTKTTTYSPKPTAGADVLR